MPVRVAIAHMKPDPIHNTCVRFGIIYNYVTPVHQGIDTTHYSLVAEVQQHGIFPAHKCSYYPFKLFMLYGVPAHHPCPHRVTHSPFSSCLCIYFSNFRMIYQAEVIIKAPNDLFFAPE